LSVRDDPGQNSGHRWVRAGIVSASLREAKDSRIARYYGRQRKALCARLVPEPHFGRTGGGTRCGPSRPWLAGPRDGFGGGGLSIENARLADHRQMPPPIVQMHPKRFPPGSVADATEHGLALPLSEPAACSARFKPATVMRMRTGSRAVDTHAFGLYLRLLD